MTIHEILYILACKYRRDIPDTVNRTASWRELTSIARQLYDMNGLGVDNMHNVRFINWILWDVSFTIDFLNTYKENKLYHFVNQTDEKEYIIKEIDRFFDQQSNDDNIIHTHGPINYYRNLTFDHLPDELKT